MGFLLIIEKVFWFWLGGAFVYACMSLVTPNLRIPAWFKMFTSIIWPISLFTVLRTYMKGLNGVNSGE